MHRDACAPCRILSAVARDRPLTSCHVASAQVFKHKPKKHYQRKTGHRQPLTKFLVTKISPDS